MRTIKQQAKHILSITFIMLLIQSCNHRISDTEWEGRDKKIGLSVNNKKDAIVNNLYVFSSNGDSIRLLDLLTNRDKTLIMRIPYINCSSCVDRELYLIKNEIENKKIFPVIIITGFKRHRDFLVYTRYNSSKEILIYNYGNALTGIDSLGLPYYLFVDRKFLVVKSLIPSKLSGDSSIDFLNAL